MSFEDLFRESMGKSSEVLGRTAGIISEQLDQQRPKSPVNRLVRDAVNAAGDIKYAMPLNSDAMNEIVAGAVKMVIPEALKEGGEAFGDLGSWAGGDDESDDDSSEQKEKSADNSADDEAKAPDYDIDEMAGEFILGAWGNGQDRIDNMLKAGYTLDDYNKIQQRVNEAYASGRDLHEWTNKANEKLHYW